MVLLFYAQSILRGRLNLLVQSSKSDKHRPDPSNLMSTQYKKEQVGDRTEWILRILYAPANGEAAVPVIGETRLMKACFLVHRKLREEAGIETDFSFRADDYGPLDPLVYDAVEILEIQGEIRATESNKYNGTEYSLTSRGETKAKQLYSNLSEQEQELLSWVKSRHILSPLPKLLSFVYNQYPDMAENSKIA